MFANRQDSRVLQKIGVIKVDGDVRRQTGSRNVAILRIRNQTKYAL